MSALNTDGQFLVFDFSGRGSVKIRLRDDSAPQHCAAIRTIVARKLYDGCTIYRAEPNFVVQVLIRDFLFCFDFPSCLCRSYFKTTVLL